MAVVGQNTRRPPRGSKIIVDQSKPISVMVSIKPFTHPARVSGKIVFHAKLSGRILLRHPLNISLSATRKERPLRLNIMVFCPEHSKQDQNPKFTPLSETKSIPTPFIYRIPTQPPPPQSGMNFYNKERQPEKFSAYWKGHSFRKKNRRRLRHSNIFVKVTQRTIEERKNEIKVTFTAQLIAQP